MMYVSKNVRVIHCVKSVQIQSFFWSVFSPNTGKYGPEKTPYLDTFHAVIHSANFDSLTFPKLTFFNKLRGF